LFNSAVQRSHVISGSWLTFWQLDGLGAFRTAGWEEGLWSVCGRPSDNDAIACSQTVGREGQFCTARAEQEAHDSWKDTE